MHRTTDRFWKCFYQLPRSIRDEAREQFDLLKANPNHPSLHFKKVGKFWSARISLFYRALAIKDGNDYIWIWIGTHDEYEKLIRSRA